MRNPRILTPNAYSRRRTVRSSNRTSPRRNRTRPKPRQPAAARAVIFAGIDAGLSVLSLFKTDTEFHGVAVTADDLALQALVSKQWRDLCGAKASKVIHPSYSYPPIETDLASNDLLNSLTGLSKDLAEVSLMYQNLTDRVQAPLGKGVDGLRKLIADYRDTGLLITVLEAKLK